MNKTEFLKKLEEHLEGQMEKSKIQTHIQYYREYIETQIKSGKTEEQLWKELGEPHLIAKTLLDADKDAVQDFYKTYRENEIYEEESENSIYGKSKVFKLDLTSWYGKLIVIILAVLIILGLLIIIGTLLPILAVTAIILYIVSYIKKKGKKQKRQQRDTGRKIDVWRQEAYNK